MLSCAKAQLVWLCTAKQTVHSCNIVSKAYNRKILITGGSKQSSSHVITVAHPYARSFHDETLQKYGSIHRMKKTSYRPITACCITSDAAEVVLPPAGGSTPPGGVKDPFVTVLFFVVEVVEVFILAIKVQEHLESNDFAGILV